uniref:Uncharacterized protein n=1 Tax=Myotis myotis TaxID=51298 RepID=A0A7J7T6E8_MYOMY|nr:hypothetical protein mMyoMyo1_009208 [Myotis myotis]
MLWIDRHHVHMSTGTEGRNGARVRAGLLQVARALAGETEAGSWRPINRDDGDENLPLKQIWGEGRSQTGTTRLVGQDSLVANNRYSLGVYWRATGEPGRTQQASGGELTGQQAFRAVSPDQGSPSQQHIGVTW